MRSHNVGSGPSNINLNIASLIVPPIEFIFCHNFLRSATWFGKSSPSQRYRLFNYSSTFSFAISDILSYKSIRELQSLSAIPNISTPSLIILQILYIRNPFIQVFCAFYSLAVDSLVLRSRFRYDHHCCCCFRFYGWFVWISWFE